MTTRSSDSGHLIPPRFCRYAGEATINNKVNRKSGIALNMNPSLNPLQGPASDQYLGEEGYRLSTIVRLLSQCLEQGYFQEAVTVFVNQLATRFNCSRVSLGFSRFPSSDSGYFPWY
ncbi:MAG: hypothetical protein GY703_20140 [Gammaproteobacteria bacterium]|nr:hypothetical protein [Gammaproteobacteria bacterium]